MALSEDDFSFPTVSTAPVKRLNSVAEHLELEYDESSFSSKTQLTRRQNMLKVAATSLGSQAKSHFFDLLYSYIALQLNIDTWRRPDFDNHICSDQCVCIKEARMALKAISIKMKLGRGASLEGTEWRPEGLCEGLRKVNGIRFFCRPMCLQSFITFSSV